MQASQQHFDERINRDNTINEFKLEKIKIDADLKAKARIEWIQNVRSATANFVASCYSMFMIYADTDYELIKHQYLELKKYELLLLLYFGPDKSSSEGYDNTSNKGKNDKIYELVKKIMKINEEIYSKYGEARLEIRHLRNLVSEAYGKVPKIKFTSYDNEGEEHEDEDPNMESEEWLEYMILQKNLMKE